MNIIQIYNVLKHIDRHDVGVYARDNIRPPRGMKCAFVFNTDPSYLREQHWVAVYINGNGVGYYFDSYGKPPQHRQLIYFLKRHCKRWVYNNVCVQPLMSTACGYFCLYFLIHMSGGRRSMKDVVKSMTEEKAIRLVQKLTHLQ